MFSWLSVAQQFDVPLDYLNAHVDVKHHQPLALGQVIRGIQQQHSANSVTDVDIAASSVRVSNTWTSEYASHSKAGNPSPFQVRFLGFSTS